MGFKDKSFASRRGVLGDVAEAKFEELIGEPYIKYGLRRPDDHGIRVQDLPHRIRHQPDFLTAKGLVEVLGCGRDGLVKLGVTKYQCLLFWHSVFPVRIFVWNSQRRKHAIVPLEAIMDLLDRGQVGLATFPESKAYFSIKWDDLA